MDGVLIKIAFRNLRQHMTKTLIIGILIAFGIAILVVGNSFMDTVKAGIEKNYIENYTGNLFIAPAEIADPSLIISNELFESGPKVLPDYQKIQAHVESLPQVTGTAGQINGVVSAKWGERGEAFLVLFGISSSEYQQLFPTGVNIIEGEFLQEGQEGVVISKTVAEMFSETAKEAIEPGDTIVLTSINTVSGTKIRKVTVRGIHDYGDASFDLSFVCFIDDGNLRVMNGLLLNSAQDLQLSEEEIAALEAYDEESLFGAGDPGDSGNSGDSDDSAGSDLFSDGTAEDDLFSSGTAEEDLFSSGTASADSENAAAAWEDILGDTSERAYLSETDPNAWNYLLVKVENHDQTPRTVSQLNSWFEDQGIEARAWNWIDGAGMSAQLADTISIVFNVLIFIIAVVAVIIIMNTLVISVSERYGEIGTMRAIGARKGFVRRMISLETLMITIVFGAVGVVVGIIVLLIFRAVGIEASNQFLQILLGGDVFRPMISGWAIVSSVIMVSLVGLVSSLYPVSVALRISPLEAMNKG